MVRTFEVVVVVVVHASVVHPVSCRVRHTSTQHTIEEESRDYTLLYKLNVHTNL